jgi:hypothetical protein
MNEKVCCVCRESLPLEEFNDRTDAADGKQAVCRQCKRQQSKDWAQKVKKKKRSEDFWNINGDGIYC